jgi:hypothetical protein
MERGGTCRRPRRRWAQEQDGLIREALFFVVLVGLFAVILLDVIAIYSSHRAVKEDARRAADVAVAAYVQTASDAAAQQAAAAYLGSHKTQLIAFDVKRSQNATVYEVTARRTVNTLVLKYVGHLPKIGKWMERQLHPEATAGNQ